MNFLNFVQDYFRLRQFYYVAKAGSLSGAARMMGVTHVSLCRSMQILEHRLKTKLFKREARGFKLTADGERLLEHTLKNFQDNEAFLNAFLDKGEELAGEIKIITTPAEGETILTNYLLPFLDKHPNLSIPILTTTNDFDTQNADVAIRTFIPGRQDLEQLPLREFELKLWASPEYISKYGAPKDEADLDNHKLLVFRDPNLNLYFNYQNQCHWLLQAGNHGEQPRMPFYQITSHEGVFNAASKGYGIAQFPEDYIKIKGSQLTEVLPDIQKPVVTLYFICNKKLAKSKKIKALYDYLISCFGKLE